jgi:hypothetical protein
MSDSLLYQSRVSSGDYDRLSANLLTFNKHALVNLEYGRDFERDSRRGFKIISESENRRAPFSTWLFGEIAPHSVGTLHQASGNHYIGCPPVSTSLPSGTLFLTPPFAS